MSSLLIKGIIMPLTCEECPCYDANDNSCNATGRGVIEYIYSGRPDNCPLVELHTPHGRLIEAEDELMMVKCIECFHLSACRGIKAVHGIVETHSDTDQIMCSFYEPRIPFIERKTAVWVKNSPNKDVMREFHQLGIARGMSENSTFWTCSNCGSWGSLTYNYCPQCGVKIGHTEQQLKEREV